MRLQLLRVLPRRALSLAARPPPARAALLAAAPRRAPPLASAPALPRASGHSALPGLLRHFSTAGSDDDDGGDDEKKPPRRRRTPRKKEKEEDEEGEEGEGSDEPPSVPPGRGGVRLRTGAPPPTQGDDDDGDDDEPEEVVLSKLKRPRDERGLVVQDVPEDIPDVLVLGLERAPIFPAMIKPIEISDRGLISKVKHLMKIGFPFIGTFLLKPPISEGSTYGGRAVTDLAQVEPVGTLAQIRDLSETRNGAVRLELGGIRRIKITGSASTTSDVPVGEDAESIGDASMAGEPQENQGLMQANIVRLNHLPFDRDRYEIKALVNEILGTLKDILVLNPFMRELLVQNQSHALRSIDNPVYLADYALTMLSSPDPISLQDVLQELDVSERLNKVLELTKRELLQLKLQSQLSKDVELKLQKMHREGMLREQLKLIKKELGMTKDDGDSLAEAYNEALKGKTVPEEVMSVIKEEREKLSTLEPRSSEFNVTRTYLDWLTSLPWGQASEEKYDVEEALKILDEDHYGMKDVKDRILEFIAVGKLHGKMQGKILTFVGPPGVGKTSIAKSIARALNRKYYRFSVGGLHDVAEIKGHRRTYVGAMPGKIIQCLKKVQAENPLILLDEVDKIGTGRHGGDPTSALLEVLDPEQNHNFLDHYLDVPVNLSQVLFLCTANVMDTIPGPLVDRMETIELSGYMESEKVAIAQRYLIPQAQKETGMTPEQFQIEPDAIQALIRSYCRESGVRNLRKHIDKIFRKGALELVRTDPHPSKPLVVTADNLTKYVGQPLFQSARMYDDTPPGVVTGLAWTALGGTVLYIETVASRRLWTVAKVPEAGEPASVPVADKTTPGFALTGQLGDVMKESAQIAYTFSKHFLEEIMPENTFFSRADIRLHVPEGATPKDGPSAGSTMVTALVSLATDTPVRKNLAMTGEVSLTGKILRVGGIKEKTLAAKRSGITTIILPELNRADWEELPDSVKEGLEVHFASHYSDIYKIAFEGQKSLHEGQ